MSQYDLLIVGAGISGVSLAHHAARRGLTTKIIESANRVGGALHTHHCGTDDSDFWVELGAHTCYNSYGALIEVLEQAGLTGLMLKREKVPFRMRVDDRIRSIPSQIRFLELLLAMPCIFFLDKTRESIESYYARIVGRKNFETVFEPMFNAVPSQRSNDFPADMLFKKRPRRKDLSRSFTFQSGLGSIVRQIAAQPSIDIETGNAAVEIDQDDSGFAVTTANGSQYQSRYLALATPAVAATRLVRPVNAELADTLARIKVVSFQSTGVVVNKSDLKMEPVAAIVPTQDCFYSVVSRDTVPDATRRGFTFHFKTGQKDDQARLQRIGEVLDVSVEDFSHVGNRKNVLPSFQVGHQDWVKRVDGLLAGGRLLLTGNYFSGVSIEDCVLRSRGEAARLRS